MDFDFSSALSKVPSTRGDTILIGAKNADPEYKGILIEIREIGWSEDDCDGLRYDSCFVKNFYMQYPNDLVFFKTNQWEAKGYKVVFKRTLFATYTTRFIYLIVTPYKKQFIIDVYGITDGYNQIADKVIKNIRFKSPWH